MPLIETLAGASAKGYGWGATPAAGGLTLTQRTLPVTYNLIGYQKGGSSDLWLIGSAGSTSIATSSDGITWTTATASQALLSAISAKPAGQYVTADGSTVRYSAAGTTWSSATPYWTGSMTFLRYWGGAVLSHFKKLTSSAAESSSAGSTWTNRSGTNYTGYDQVNNGSLFGFPAYATSYFMYTDNASWASFTQGTLPSTKNWLGGAYDSTNGKFVVFDDSGTGAYSSNGTSWTQITLPTLSGYTYASSSDGGNGCYVIGGTSGYLYSTDATTFKKITMPSGDYYAQYDSANTRFLIMKSASTTYYTGVKP